MIVDIALGGLLTVLVVWIAVLVFGTAVTMFSKFPAGKKDKRDPGEQYYFEVIYSLESGAVVSARSVAWIRASSFRTGSLDDDASGPILEFTVGAPTLLDAIVLGNLRGAEIALAVKNPTPPTKGTP